VLPVILFARRIPILSLATPVRSARSVVLDGSKPSTADRVTDVPFSFVFRRDCCCAIQASFPRRRGVLLFASWLSGVSIEAAGWSRRFAIGLLRRRVLGSSAARCAAWYLWGETMGMLLSVPLLLTCVAFIVAALARQPLRRA
jgi:hypothetical protein